MEITLHAKLREGKVTDPKAIPAVVYGAGENRSLEIKLADFEKVFSLAGESNLINLEIEGDKSIKVLVKDTQKHHLQDTFIHVDFYQVYMDKKVTTEIPLKFLNEAPAVKELGGQLNKNLDFVEVECLPNDLVDHLEVDLSVLKTFQDHIRLSDLHLPQGMELTAEDKHIMIAQVVEAKIQVEEVTASAEPTAAVKEETKDEKKEDKKNA
jgi:large subunit ribosomal protein L25